MKLLAISLSIILLFLCMYCAKSNDNSDAISTSGTDDTGDADDDDANDDVTDDDDTSGVPDQAAYIRRDGDKLLLGSSQEVIQLRGMNFTPFHCQFWEADPTKIINYEHHREADFQKIRNMGMNAIRLDILGEMFEDSNNPYTYKEEAWNWMESHVLAWARAHNVYVIINMHNPPGYDRSGNKIDPDAPEYYESGELRNRMKALWKEIARRYADEPIIAAYDLVNEPHMESNETYRILIEELISEIRSVDTKHLLIIELNYMYREFFTVSDANVMYDYHFYEPIEYTYQNYGPYGEYGSYPTGELTKSYLESSLLGYISWTQANNFPFFCGEFGATFANRVDTEGNVTQNAYGFLLYIGDILDLFHQYNIHYTFYAYHDAQFGLYSYNNPWESWEGYPNENYFNQDLHDLIVEKLTKHKLPSLPKSCPKSLAAK